MLIIAHRGASGYAPENTVAAFRLALDQKAQGIELDVQLSKDNEVVVIHDWTLERTTNGVGKIKDKTLKELKKLDAGSWFSSQFKNERISTLDEVLGILPNKIILNIEIKSKYSLENNIGKRILEILDKSKYPIENIIISSFSHRILKDINKINKDVKLGLLISSDLINFEGYIKSTNLDIFSLHLDRNFLSDESIKENKKHKIYPWTVNDLKDMERLKKLGVNGIITNYPDIAKKVVM